MAIPLMHRKMRTHGATPLFSASFIKSILKNPVYCGKIAYGRNKTETVHLLSSIMKCPVCVAGMYANKFTKKRKDGTFYKHFYYYGCKHRGLYR